MTLYLPTSTIEDHPSKWESRFYDPPLGFGPQLVAEYQAKLNKIAGTAPDGSPILRLDWGGNTKHRMFIRWDEFGNPTESQEVPTYQFRRVGRITGIEEMIPIKRWIIAERGEPEQYRANDPSDTMFQEGGVTKQRREKPRDGYYTPLVVIGDHSKCPPNCSVRKMCYGDYKHPSDAELDWVRDVTNQLAQEKDRLDPRKQVSVDKAFKMASKANREAREKSAKELKEHIDEFAKDWFRTHGHRLTTDIVSHGKWFDLNPNSKKS